MLGCVAWGTACACEEMTPLMLLCRAPVPGHVTAGQAQMQPGTSQNPPLPVYRSPRVLQCARVVHGAVVSWLAAWHSQRTPTLASLLPWVLPTSSLLPWVLPTSSLLPWVLPTSSHSDACRYSACLRLRTCPGKAAASEAWLNRLGPCVCESLQILKSSLPL